MNSNDEWMAEFEDFHKQFIDRKIHRELNVEVIANIPDEWLIQAIVDFVGLSIDGDWEQAKQKMPSLGEGFSAVYFLSLLQTEVNNGGFNQMFYNQGHEAVVGAKRGANLIGAERLSSLLDSALELEVVHRTKMARVKEKRSLDAFMASYDDMDFTALDDEFFKEEKKITSAILSFIRKNGHLFTGKIDT